MKQSKIANMQSIDDFKSTSNNKIFDVSVVIITYNPIWKKLKLTLDSIIAQQGVSMQIIVADDGSKDNLFDYISAYFLSKAFFNYRLIRSDKNKGTVSNLLNACCKADGKYIKSISPGDCLYNDNTLYKWISSLRESGKKWSFGDAVYYYINRGVPQTVISKPHPQNVKPYINDKCEECRWNYVALFDTVLGAAVISERHILLKYLNMINGKVVYAEDMIFRLIMFDGEVGYYYNDVVVVYEYGTGISTCGSDVWKNRLEQDLDAVDIEILSRIKDKFQKKMAKAILHRLEHRSKISSLFIKDKLKMYIRRKLFPRKTPNIDISKLPYFNQEDEG